MRVLLVLVALMVCVTCAFGSALEASEGLYQGPPSAVSSAPPPKAVGGKASSTGPAGPAAAAPTPASNAARIDAINKQAAENAAMIAELASMPPVEALGFLETEDPKQPKSAAPKSTKPTSAPTVKAAPKTPVKPPSPKENLARILNLEKLVKANNEKLKKQLADRRARLAKRRASSNAPKKQPAQKSAPKGKQTLVKPFGPK